MSTSQNPSTTQNNIENDMCAISDWFCANKLSLNAQKTNFMVDTGTEIPEGQCQSPEEARLSSATERQ